MVVEVLVTERQAQYPLPHQLPHAVPDGPGVTVIDELLGEPLDDPAPPLRLHEQQPPHRRC